MNDSDALMFIHLIAAKLTALQLSHAEIKRLVLIKKQMSNVGNRQRTFLEFILL